MSERQEIAEAIAAWIRNNNLCNPFGGDVTKNGRYYAVLFSYPRYLDGLVRIYGPKFILVESQGPWGRGSRVYELMEDALYFMQAQFIEHNTDLADDVPTKPQKNDGKVTALHEDSTTVTQYAVKQVVDDAIKVMKHVKHRIIIEEI